MMATCKGLLHAALKPGDKPEDLVCFYQPFLGDASPYEWGPVQRCTFDELPEREFDSGFGGVEGEPCIAFSHDYVYVKGAYDGSEWMDAVPRRLGVIKVGVPYTHWGSSVALPQIGG